MTDNITGKVARILNSREVVLNKGSSSGMAVGYYIGIIDPTTQGIQDPETGEDICGIRRYKVTLRVTDVSERLCIAATFRTTTENVGGLSYDFPGMRKMFEPPKIISRIETLEFDADSARPISQDDSRVELGDDFETISEEKARSGYTLLPEELEEN